MYQILTACVNVLDGHLHRSTKIFNKVRVVAVFVLEVYVMIVTIYYMSTCADSLQDEPMFFCLIHMLRFW